MSKLWAYLEVMSLAEAKGAGVVLLLFNMDLDGVSLTRYLADLEMGFPVYIDDCNVFLEENPAITRNPRMHTLLISRTGHPVFVGDPTLSPKLAQLFNEALNMIE